MPRQPNWFHDEVTPFVYDGRTVHVIYLCCSKTSGMVSLNILVPLLCHYSLEGLTNTWVKHQLDDEAERAVVKGSYPYKLHNNSMQQHGWRPGQLTKECPEERDPITMMMPYEPLGLTFQKECGETGEGPEEVCQDGARGLKHEL
ncbi:hypothetical protein QYF61_009349 [Mycteria americana]|uniref:Uncharacterized protein n=1 Tax=Mycteria americana TaxID=33587 RepID=A0AAN7MH78_MYCAM|nr:hypothetical protein QYF61_009349 [Mycteria americana]